MNPLLKAIARLRATLLEMEAELGLVALSEAEKAILAAATLAADEQGIFDLETLQDQIMVTDLSHSTFFRGIRSLTEKGLIDRITDTKRSAYRVMVR